MFMLGLGMAQAQQTCPSPLPTCASQGNFELVNGTYGCTEVTAHSDNTVEVGVIVLTAGGGTLNGSSASNSNQSSGTTYNDFSQQSISGTICVNADNTTGYLTPSASSKSCPLAMTLGGIVSNTATQIRLLGTAEGRSQTVVCRLQ
ncbi:MAG TPA: hypothetical protein VKV28_07530 [Candidatus Binataceae bacterium]|nr:hypothetical protein [Candidatus Binataceae bacterium]